MPQILKNLFDGFRKARWTSYLKVCLIVLVIVTIAGFREDALRAVSLLDGAVAESDYALLLAALIFVVGSFLFVPQWMLIAGAVAGFGLWTGSALAWGATMTSAFIHVGLGTVFKDRLRAYLNGPRWARVEQIISKNSFQSGFLVRLVPTGPAIVVNLAAVLAGVRLSRFLLGTSLGIMPKIILTALITQGLLSSVQGQRIGLSIAVIVSAGAAGYFLNRWLKDRAIIQTDSTAEK